MGVKCKIINAAFSAIYDELIFFPQLKKVGWRLGGGGEGVVMCDNNKYCLLCHVCWICFVSLIKKSGLGWGCHEILNAALHAGQHI